jgi:hypothetical protein
MAMASDGKATSAVGASAKPTFIPNPAVAAGNVVQLRSDVALTPRGGPPNGECTDAVPSSLSIGGSVVFTGDSTGESDGDAGTFDGCSALGADAVWHAVTTDATGDLTIAMCGTDPNANVIYIVIDDNCPCDGSFVFATSYEFLSCADDTDGDGFSNGTMQYLNLPAGTYYLPVFTCIGDECAALGYPDTYGPYTMTVSLAEGGGGGEGEGEGEGEGDHFCGENDQDCCLPGSLPTCGEVDCCEAVCAIDPFCCDTLWDSLCADEAEAEDACDEGSCVPPPPPTCDVWQCDGDANGDGVVDPLDSGYILARFGLDPCDEGCSADVNCDGVIDPLDSGYSLARFGTCDEPPPCTVSCPGQFADHCADAVVTPLNAGSSIEIIGNNTGADMECAAGGFEEEWAAVSTTETLNITLSLCGTTPAFENAYIVIDDSCPCDGSWLFATSFENTCDGNWVVHYDGVPAGTWYLPLLSGFLGGDCDGDFVWTISAE